MVIIKVNAFKNEEVNMEEERHRYTPNENATPPSSQDDMRMREHRSAPAEDQAPQFMAEYTVQGWDETLSHVALKYYGNATRPYFLIIYEANKDVIGDNMNIIKPGMKLKIPVLPDELKKK
jgi:nucleoid-associated protein YgaU